MPDYRRMMDPGPNDPITPELIRQWNPGGPPRGMELDPAYSDRYLLDEGSQDTLGNLVQTLQGASGRTENIDAGLERLQGLQEEQKTNLQPLWDLGQTSSGPGLLDQLRGGLSSIGGALSNGLDAITPSQGTVDNIAMRLQNAHAIGTGRAPLWMQQQEHQMQLGQQQELMQMRRAQVAQQLQQQQMMKQQKDEDQALGIWKDHQMPIAMKKKISQQLAAQGNVLAGNLHRLGDEQLVAEMDSLGQYLPKGKMEELTQLMKTPNADLEHVERWVGFAREKKKVIGDRQMKSERFSDLLGRYNAGEIDPSHPDYDEFKQGILEREKAQQENTEMRMKLEQMGLTKKKAEQELQINSLMPQVSEEIPMAGGKTGKYVVDPQTMQRQLMTGEKKPLVEVNTGTKASEEAAKKYIDKTSENYEKLRDTGVLLKNIEESKALIPKAKLFMGPMGETWMEGVKFLNNRLGTNIRTDNVKSAEELRSRLFTGVIENLRKLDPTPAVEQMKLLREAVGNLGTDPNALGNVLDIFGDAARRKVEQHNKEVLGAKREGTRFPFDPIIELPSKAAPFTMSKDEFETAKGLHQQGLSKDQIQQEILKRRGGK